MTAVDLIDRIDELQVIIEEAKSVPLSSSAVVNREEVLELLAQIKELVPEEVRRARWMTRDRDELLARAYKEAERIQIEAAAERDRLVSHSEITLTAGREAERIVGAAKEAAARLGVDAEDYVDQRLAAFEIWLNKALAAVLKGREQLQTDRYGASPGPGAAGAPPEEHPFDAAQLGGPPA